MSRVVHVGARQACRLALAALLEGDLDLAVRVLTPHALAEVRGDGKHPDMCECADCWQQMEGNSKR